MLHDRPDQRIDLVMRQFVGQIIEYLMRGGDHANALLNMSERGVPQEVQRRVLGGNATRH